ncbi:MAG: DUF4175 family protein [Rhodospirillaceae bacterium]|nr:DUF4175 family protein [Rhodospirillaceae bacterium]
MNARNGGGRKSKGAVSGYGLRSGLSWLALTWEQLWPRFWVSVAIVILFAALVLFDVLPLLPGLLHAGVLAVFGIGFLFAAAWGFRRLRLPRRLAADRRLERTSGLEHRPLTTVRDAVAVGSGDAFSEAIWNLHQEKARAALENLRVGAPRPRVARRDPFALRGLAVIFLVLGLTVGWSDSSDRFARAFLPNFESGVTEPVTVEAWFTPPDYTGLPPRMITLAHDGKPVIVPQDTEVLLHLHGGKGQPMMTLGKQKIRLQNLDRSSWQGKLLARNGGELVVRQRARDAVRWKISVMPDLAPKISWSEDPEVTQRQNVRLSYKASDDHNVRKVRVYIARVGEVDVITVKAPVSGGKQITGRVYKDLTPHRWAGLGVSMMFEAEDNLGQRGNSKFKDMTLPERIFHHPAARAIIAQRKRLTVEPEEIDQVVDILGHIAVRRQAYRNDPTVYLALRMAQGRLILGSRHDGRDDTDVRQGRDMAIRSVQPILWQTALRLEEDATSDADRELARIQRKLEELLSRKDIKDQELKRLLDELRRSMKDYMDAMRREMKRRPDQFSQRQLTGQDITRLLERMRELMRDGDKEALRRMLSRLHDMMQNMPPGQQQQRVDRNHPAQRMMRDLSDLMRRQQKLMDESFRRGQQRRDGGEQHRRADRDAARQQSELRKKLGEMMRRLGEMTGKVPRNFGNAESEMRRSQRDLSTGRPGRSVGPQGRALRELGRGMRQAMRQMARRFGMQRGPGRFSGERARRFDGDRDPLGRRMDGLGPLDQNDVKIPTEAERKKASDILRELRRRSGESERPKLEKDYIDRLLKRF